MAGNALRAGDQAPSRFHRRSCQVAKPTIRTLVVGELVQRRRRSEAVVPFIRLAGKWLHDAGFRSGDSIAVEVTAGRMWIVKIPDGML